MHAPDPPHATDEHDDVEVRREVATRWLGRIDTESGKWQTDLAPVTMTLVDALLHGDAGTLQELADPLRDALATMFEDQGHAREIRGYLLGVLEATRWGLRRLPDPGDIEFAKETHAWQMLDCLGHGPLTSSDLKEQLGTSDSQISRVGRNLLARQMVVQRRAGRVAVWEITARGRQAMEYAANGNARRTN
ncbi:MAG: hypothetical protein ACR2OB_01955 [Solirubrobacteraceae bacterium]